MSKQEQIDAFIDRLGKLESGERAQLKRHAGKMLSESTKVMPIFFRLLPYGVSRYDEEWYFLVATLYPLCEAKNEDEGKVNSFGLSMRMARAKEKQSEDGFDRRFAALLDTDTNQVSFRLRQLIRLHKSADNTPVAWRALLNDLVQWTHPDRYIQEKWARHYYVGNPKTTVNTLN